jgi:energy-coupling factor transporter ATP-binding protein EcfA2
MKISKLNIKNYRSISSLGLEFPTFYTAISGKNDAGKTNVLTAIRGTFEAENPFYYNEEISPKDDLPKWITKESKDRTIVIQAELLIFGDSDAGLYVFLKDYLALADPGPHLSVSVRFTVSAETPDGDVGLEVDGKAYERLKAQEVLKKLQSSRTFLFHDSTEFITRARHYPHFADLLFGQLAGADSDKLEAAKARLNKTVGTITKRQQKEISDLLGRLKDRYTVGISLKQAFDPEYLPFSVTLGAEGVNVDLEDWGSGTQNRTWILMTLFKAKRVSHSEISASKITPIIVIEEPESFLHPSAQAEFGKVIQDLAEEFQVQVIVATHSPYMLSQDKPESNILLQRHVEKKRVRETVRVDTSSNGWMAPFALALGLDN